MICYKSCNRMRIYNLYRGIRKHSALKIANCFQRDVSRARFLAINSARYAISYTRGSRTPGFANTALAVVLLLL